MLDGTVSVILMIVGFGIGAVLWATLGAHTALMLTIAAVCVAWVVRQ